MLFVAACGGGGSESSDSAPDPQALLKSATDATAAVKSFHFKLEHEHGSLALPVNLKLDEAKGDVVVPDRLKANVSATNGSIKIDVDAIAIGDQTWITNPFTRRYQQVPNASIFETIDPVGLLNVVTSKLENAAVAGSESVDGTDSWHLTGTMPSSALSGVLPAKSGNNVDFELWVGKGDNLPRRVRLEGPVTSDDASNTTRVIDFTRFDEDVTISPPS
jgi:lipoprotein LprG